MISLRTLLATTNWLSLIILIWLLVLNIVPAGGVQGGALAFFFVTALAATFYDPAAAAAVSTRSKK